jgi:hypothetical protein
MRGCSYCEDGIPIDFPEPGCICSCPAGQVIRRKVISSRIAEGCCGRCGHPAHSGKKCYVTDEVVQ